MSKIVTVRFDQERFAKLHRESRLAGLTVSEYLRRTSTKQRIPNALDYDAVKDLMNANADLARLGNLMKMCLSNIVDCSAKETEQAILDLNNLMLEARTLQGNIKKIVMQIKP